MSETEEQKPTNRGVAQLISYETGRLQAIAMTYPEKMRDHFLWLGDYIREKCARNLDSLEHKLKQMGLPTTAGTLSKILRGRYNTNAKGEPCPPVMALENFIAMVEKLRSDPEIVELVGEMDFVETTTYHTISDYIDVRRAPGCVCPFGFIIGPTGAQKTASYKHYKSLPKNNRSCIWMEAPERPRQGQFITDLAYKYGVSLHLSQVRKRAKIREYTTAKTVIIIDNIQRLYNTPDGRDLESTGQPIFSYLQQLQDETGFTPILSATPDFYDQFLNGISKGYFEQFEGRAGGRHEFLILPHYAPQEDLLQIAAGFGLKDAEQHLGYLQQISRLPGRIRIFCRTLQIAKQDATTLNEELTIEHVKQIIPPSRFELKEAA